MSSPDSPRSPSSELLELPSAEVPKTEPPGKNPPASQPVNNQLVSALDSAFLLAATTGLMVFWGFTYYASFYQRVGFEELTAFDATQKYLLKSAVTIAGLAFLTLSLWDMYRPRGAPPTNPVEAFVANAFYLSIFVILFVWQTSFFTPSLAWTLGLVTAGISLATLFGKAVWQLYDDFPPALQTAVWILLGLAIGTLCFAAKGTAEATKLIEGMLSSGSTIELHMRDESSPFHGRTFPLVEQVSDRYYVVDLAKPAPGSPTLFVVEASEVEYAAIGRMSANDPPANPTATPNPP